MFFFFWVCFYFVFDRKKCCSSFLSGQGVIKTLDEETKDSEGKSCSKTYSLWKLILQWSAAPAFQTDWEKNESMDETDLFYDFNSPEETRRSKSCGTSHTLRVPLSPVVTSSNTLIAWKLTLHWSIIRIDSWCQILTVWMVSFSADDQNSDEQKMPDNQF